MLPVEEDAATETLRVGSELATVLATTQETDGTTARRVARAGETVTLAGNVPHTVRNESTEDAVAFQVHAPGGPMEGFTRSAAHLAADHTPTIEEVLAIAESHGIELLGPVPDLGSA